MRVWLIPAAALGGCVGYPADSVADLAQTVVCSDTTAAGWSFHHGPVASISNAGCGDETCHWLAPAMTASFADMPVPVHGGGSYTNDEGSTSCSPGWIGPPPSWPERSTAPDTSYELSVVDPTGAARMTLIGPFAPRSFAVVGGTLTSGQPARIAVSPATDTLHGVSTTFDGAWLDCFEGADQPRIFELTKTDLAIDGNAITFTVPTTTFHGTATCYLGVTVAVGVADCTGFLGCVSLVAWPQNPGSALHPEAWSFTAQL